MKKSYPYLNDKVFLQQLINSKHLTYFAKIDILNWEEKTIKQIENKVISGSFNINSSSIIRRTANLTLVLNENDAVDLLSLNRKVDIAIGYENFSNKYNQYPIIWFPMGVYVVTNVNLSHSTNTTTASLELKDKMCLLNGQCGGTLSSSVIFDNAETTDENGNIMIVRPTIYQIIRQLVNHFGGQQLGKIIISDLDIRVKQAMQWTGTSPLYFLQNSQNQYFLTTNSSQYQSKRQQGYRDIDGSPFSYGNDVGFIITDFTYPGDLIGDAGNTITDILEKIKNILGNYEYFYDIDGNFVFREIKNYLNNAQSKYILDSLNNNQFVPDYLAASGQSYLLSPDQGRAVFSFKSNQNIVTSYSNSPKLNLIKNDFIVWGMRKGTEGYQFPIRYHLAIDEKPSVGNTYKAFKYVSLDDNFTEKWYIPLQFNSLNNFPTTGLYGVFYLATDTQTIYQWKLKDDLLQYVPIEAQLVNITTKDWRTELYFQGVAAQPYGLDSNYYYTELLNEWPKLYNILPDYEENGEIHNNSGFKEEFIKNPSQIDYYLDFLEPRNSKTLEKFAINNIGRRTEVMNKDKNTNCVFQPFIPDVVLIKIDNLNQSEMSKLREECIARRQNYYQVEESIYNALQMGGRLFSCYEEIKQTLQQYITYNESITLQTLPVYFLEPNTIIEVEDSLNNIYGNYIINTLSFNLGTANNLTINATRVLEKV